MSVTAVVPVWNGRDDLAKLLASLEAQTEPAGELLVIDNGSADGAPEMARARGARVIAMGRNAGFAPAVNRGIRESRGQWVAVLNSDVRLAPDYFARLRSAGAPFATGKILMESSPDRIDGVFDALCRGGCAARLGHGASDGPLFSQSRAIWSAPWTAVLFQADVFRRVGLLEEAFESYLEDVEFGMRCALNDLSGRYVPEAVAWHRGSAALGRWHPETVRRIARNQCFLAAKFTPHRFSWPVLVAQSLWGLLALRHGAGRAWLRGKLEGMRACGKFQLSPEAVDHHLLRETLDANERLIAEIQGAVGFDWYWRMYFLLTHGGTK